MDGDDGDDPEIGQLCRDAIQTLDAQAQTLVKTVSDWFWQDRPVDATMQRASLSASSSDDQQQQYCEEDELAGLDGMVQEMADTCQVLERYQRLIQAVTTTSDEDDNVDNNNQNQSVVAELLQEWTWKYGALERFLALQQWRTALQHAVPVTIVLGTEIRVPSTLEDAQYLSNRALRRAASTRSLQAVATVALAVTHDVWSTEDTGGDVHAAVYQALLNQMGCWSSEVELQPHKSPEKEDHHHTSKGLSPPPSSGFASALLEALDDDEGQQVHSTSPHKSPNKPAAAPSSGNFLTSLLDKDKVQQRELDSLFCLLNGMQAASGASRALVTFLDGLLEEDEDFVEDEKATSMVQLAREELSRYADTYQTLLQNRIQESLEQWCGDPTQHDAAVVSLSQKGCLRDLQLFLEHENYHLDGNSIGPAEADERLEKELIGPLRDSKFLQQLRDKCELEVLQATAERVAVVVVEIVLRSLWSTEVPKKFTDWGSLLLSKQARMLQTFVSSTLLQPSSRNETDGGTVVAPVVPASFTAKLLQIWERLSQVATVLQLEKPSDWLLYHSTSVLQPDELARTFALRVDFSADAIQSVVASVTPKQEEHAAAPPNGANDATAKPPST